MRPVQGLALSRVNGSQCDGVGQQYRQVGRVRQDATGNSLQILIKWKGCLLPCRVSDTLEQGASLLLILPSGVTSCHLHFVTVAAPLEATAEARKLITVSLKHVSCM